MSNGRKLACAVALALGGTAMAAEVDSSSVAGPSLEEIVVTAQRREESIQKAAIAIDAVSGSSLVDRAITNSSDLDKIVPALSVNSGGGANTSISLRGVGTRTNNSFQETAVGISYDGVFMATPSAAAGASFFDLERVEVLKGPQGILYGRNATGGAINVIPARPVLGKTEGSVLLGGGNFGAWQAQGMFNLPVGDNSALRVAASLNKHDGYNKDGTNDADSQAVRLQYLFRPSEAFSLRIGADYTKLGGVGPGSSYVGKYTKTNGVYVFTPSGLPDNEGLNTPAANAYRKTLLAPPAFGFLTALQDPLNLDYKYTGLNAELAWQTVLGTVTFLPAWRKVEGNSHFDMPGFNTGWYQDSGNQKSAELRLASPTGGAVDYIAGLYWLKAHNDSKGTFNQEYVLPIQAYQSDVDSWAPFGQLTFHATDRLRLVAGARYSSDKKALDGTIDNFITFCGGAPPNNKTPPASFGIGCQVPGNLPVYPTFDSAPNTVAWLVTNGWIAQPASLAVNGQQFIPLLNGKGAIQYVNNPVDDSVTDSHVTWKASVQYDVAPQSLLYATYETGFRSGGLQLAQGYTRYKPEYLDAVSVGSKNRFLGDILQVNAEAFYWKYKDQQINYFTLSPQNTLVSAMQNVGQSTNKGLDLDVLLAVSKLTQLSLRLNYLDATYDDLHFRTAFPRDNFGCPGTAVPGAPLVGGQVLMDFNCSGMPSIYSPKFTVNAGADRTVPLGPVDLLFTINTTWRDDQWGAVEYLAHERIPAYWQTDASVGVRGSSGKWTVTAWASNLEDKRHAQAVAQSPLGTANTSFSPPRTVGVRLQAKF